MGRRAAAIAPVTVNTSPGDQHEREQLERLGLASLTGEDEDERACVQHGAQRDGGREPAAGHLSSERTAGPESSAFEMKPRARLERISPS